MKWSVWLFTMHSVHMSILIQEYGMVGASPFQGGLVPLDVMGSYTAGTRDLMEGVFRAVAGSADLSREIERVRAVGTKSDMEDAVKNFRSEVMGELKKSGEPDQWEARWNHAVDNRLGAYLPSSTHGVDSRELSEYVRQVKEDGADEVRRMAQLEGISLARQSWEKRMARAGDSGDESEMERGMDDGKGVFVPESDSSAYLRRIKERAALTRAERESDQFPIPTARKLVSGSHELSGDEDKATRLLSLVEKKVNGLKEKYGAWMLDVTGRGGFVDDQALEHAGREGLLSPSQVRNYRDSVAKEKEAVWTRRQPDADVSALCDWRRRVDERGSNEDPSLLLDIACSGLPRAEVAVLADRMKKTSLIPEDLRRKFSASLTALYNEGAWGAPGDRHSLHEWKRSQDMVLEALSNHAGDGGAEAQRIVEAQRQRMVSSWVTYGEMKKSH